MSAQMPGGWDPNNPFSSQKGGTYDTGALQGLYLRAQKGDLSARKYLQGIGVLGNMGQDIWANNDTQAGNFAPAISQWAQSTGSTPYGGQGFRFDPKWATAQSDPSFSRSWDTYFQTGGTGTDFQPASAANPAIPGNTSKPSVTGNPPAPTTPATPGTGFNPWGLYDGGTGYKGGDGVGLYQVGKDTAKVWGPNGQAETDRDRVWRMTLDDLRRQGLDPGSAPPATVQTAFMNNVSRLKQDYTNTAGLGAAAWANSAFAGYDKFLSGGGVPQTTAPATGPGTSPPIPPVSGSPTPAPTTYVDPVTGQTKTYTGNLDAGQLSKNIALQAAGNQDARLSYVMRQFGIDPTRAGLYTASIARALSPQIEASNQLNGLYGDTNSIDTAQSNLDTLAHTLVAPGGFAATQAHGRSLLADPRLQGLMGGLSDQQGIDTLQTILAQAYAGANPIYNQSRLGAFNSALGPGGSYAMYSLDHPQTGAPGYQHPLDWLANSPWAALLQGY